MAAIAKDLELKVALSMSKGVTSALLRAIDEQGIDWRDLFTPKLIGILRSVRCAPNTVQESDLMEGLDMARKEVRFMEEHKIQALFVLDDDYPVRLFQAYDAPVMLYKLGRCSLDNDKIVSVVGTRHATVFGVGMTGRLVADLAERYPGMCIVSGLAYGIDATAHGAALDNGLPTVAVLAHGLQMIYPAQHRDLARRILAAGGAIVSEYPSGTTPYRSRFLERNRIIAALADVTVIVESDVKGGAMSTARCANEYDREVMAVPGRPIDPHSSGCNALISRQRASILRDADDLTTQTGWKTQVMVKSMTPSLFPELDGDSKLVYEYIAGSEDPQPMDAVFRSTGVAMARLMPILSELEFDGLLIRHPGNRFSVKR